jgi:two-component system, NtrC family, sensor kinase
MDGLELLRQVRAIHPELDVIIVTGYSDLDFSIEALRQGASNYLLKPINLEELTIAITAVERRRALSRQCAEQEARLIQAQKLADLGMVAAGVAHEINNPNTFVRGNVQTLQKFWAIIEPFCRLAVRRSVPAPEKLNFIMAEMPNLMKAMLEGTERIKKIVDHTSSFASINSDDLGLSADVNRCVFLSLQHINADASAPPVAPVLETNLARVKGEESGLTSVITELLKNSRHATRGIEKPLIEVRTYQADDQTVCLEVSDNGVGIASSDQDKVFTPFFTTDPRIGRPGLGLSKVYALVSRFGGITTFTSREGQGTTFVIELKKAAKGA